MPSELFIDASDPSLQGLYRRANGALSALTPAIVRNDNLPRRIHVMEESVATAIERLRHRVIAGATLKVAIGQPDLGPLAGTFPLASSADSTGLTALAWNITAAALETALNANPAIAAEGSLDVTGTAPQFILTWRTFGNKAQLTTAANVLEPSSVVSIQTTQAGDASTHEEQVIRLLRRPYAYSSNWSVVSDGSTATAPQIVVGTSSTKGVVDLVLPENAESGSFRLEFTRAQVWTITGRKNVGAIQQSFFITVTAPTAAGDFNNVFWDVEDNVGPVRMWMNYNGTGSAPTAPTGGRNLAIAYNTGTAGGIRDAIRTALIADAQYAGTINFTATSLLVLQTTAGKRVSPPATVAAVAGSAGVLTMSVSIAGTNGDLAGKYFLLADNAGSVAVWFNVYNDAEPVHGATRSIEVAAIGFTTATLAATGIAAALEADAQFTATSSGTLVTATDVVAGARTLGTTTTAGVAVANTTAGAGINGEFPWDVGAEELGLYFTTYFTVTATKPRQFRFVAKANGAWAAPSISSNFVVPTYFDGTISLATTTLLAAFAATTDETLDAYLEVEYTAAGAVETILRMPVVVHRDVLDQATIGPTTVAVWLVNGDAVPIPDGTVAAPGLFFASDTNTGIYRIGADSIGITCGNSLAIAFGATTIKPQFQIQATDAVASPPYSFELDPDTGVAWSGVANTLAFVCGGAAVVTVSAVGIFAPNGAVGAPSHTFSGDPDTGVYRDAADSLALTTGGGNRMVIASIGADFTVGVRSGHATQGIGYLTGAGGTVTQATDKSTGVTLNKATGAITMNGASLAGGAIVSFTVTNSAVAAADFVDAIHASVGTPGTYAVEVTSIASGSFTITVSNRTGGALSEAIVLRFIVFKAAST